MPTSVMCSLFGSLTQESTFVQDKIRACPHNQSSWNYLRGLLSLPGGKKALVLEDIEAFCLKVSAPSTMVLSQVVVTADY